MWWEAEFDEPECMIRAGAKNAEDRNICRWSNRLGNGLQPTFNQAGKLAFLTALSVDNSIVSGDAYDVTHPKKQQSHFDSPTSGFVKISRQRQP